MNEMNHRIVAMLIRMTMTFNGIGHSIAEFVAGIDYDDEHRCAEH